MPKKVFVSGSYDMLHSGHVAFFEEAASYGDLYVGVGSDKTIAGTEGAENNQSGCRKTVYGQSTEGGQGCLDQFRKRYARF